MGFNPLSIYFSMLCNSIYFSVANLALWFFWKLTYVNKLVLRKRSATDKFYTFQGKLDGEKSDNLRKVRLLCGECVKGRYPCV